MRSVDKFHQLVLVFSMLVLSWLGMLALHELGHVLGAWATGGTVLKIVLHPLSISRVDVSPNPSPLAVVWAGPLLGCILPLAAFGVGRDMRMPNSYLLQFFAGVCCLANGAYIGAGSFGGIGDAGTMLKFGSPTWQLWLFGAVTFPLGLYLCNGLGPRFGFGENGERVSAKTAYTVLGVTVAIAVLECVLFPWE